MVTQQLGHFWQIEYDAVSFMFAHPKFTATPLITPPINGVAITLTLGAVKETRHSYNGEAVTFDLYPFAEQAFADMDSPLVFGEPDYENFTMKNPARRIVSVTATTDETEVQIPLGFIFGFALPAQFGEERLEDERWVQIWPDLPYLLEVPLTGTPDESMDAKIGLRVNGELIHEITITQSDEDVITPPDLIFNTRNRIYFNLYAESVREQAEAAGGKFTAVVSPVGTTKDAGVAQNIHFTIMECTPDVYVRWLDSYGRIHFAGFSLKSETNKTTFSKLYDTNENPAVFKVEQIGDAGYLPPTTEQETTNEKTLQCYQMGVDQNHLTELQSLLQSNFVDMMLDDAHWQRIKVVGSTTTFKRGDVVQDFAVTFDVSNINYPHR